MKISDIAKKILTDREYDRQKFQDDELATTLVDNYQLDTAHKAIMTEDLDIIAEMNRNTLYARTEIDENGLMYHPEKEDKKGDEGENLMEKAGRVLQIGHNFHEQNIVPKTSALSKYLPALAAGSLVALGLIGAASLLKDSNGSNKPNDEEVTNVDTNTDSVVRIID